MQALKAAPMAKHTKHFEWDEDVEKAREALAAGIPAGYCLQHWTIGQEWLLVGGSAFDADSLGRWIHDWAVYHSGAGTPMSREAGEIWLLLIKLAGRRKAAEEGACRVVHGPDREMVKDFISSAGRLWSRLERLLSVCDASLWTRNGKLKPANAAGADFVKTMFAIEPVAGETRCLMASMKLWEDRFAVNCSPLLSTRPRTCEACGSDLGEVKTEQESMSE